ncbi:hypothetical protein MTO96_021253 [Rhipicephalus appendiculatus]
MGAAGYRPLSPIHGRRSFKAKGAGFEAQRLGRKWSSISVWTTWHLLRLQGLLLLVHQAAADTRPRDSERPG